MEKFKSYKYIAIQTSPASDHVHCDRVKKGETYLIKKTNDSRFVAVSGTLYDRNFGLKRVIEKHILISQIQPFVQLYKELNQTIKDDKCIIYKTQN